jgi:TolB-like protein
MRVSQLRVTCLFLMVAFAIGCVSTQGFVKPGVDFSRYKMIAVVSFDSVTGNVAAQNEIADLFGMELLRRGFNVIERTQVDKVLNEQGFQASDYTTPESAAELGKILNVKAIIVGSVSAYDRIVEHKKSYVEGYTDKKGKYHPGHYQEYDETKYNVAITAKIIDTTDASILWTGAGSTGLLAIPLFAGASLQAHAGLIVKKICSSIPALRR